MAFFFYNAALVVTTVAVMEIFYTSHQLITRSHRLGTEKKQEAHKANQTTPPNCENHVRELRTFFTVVLEPNIHTFSVLSETLQDFFKSKLCYTPANSLLNTELRSLNRT